MSHWEYWLRILAIVACVFAYYATGENDIIWLFIVTWGLVHLRADELKAEIKKTSRKVGSK